MADAAPLRSVSGSNRAELAQLLLDPKVRAALVVAHPAHEVRVHHWMRRAKPSVYILTSGSRSGEDDTRLAASAHVIASAGATYVAAWGGVRDRDLYRQIIAGNASELVTATHRLARDFIDREVEIIVTDSWQHYNVAHDLTHVMARCATELATRICRRPMFVVDYPVIPYRLVPNSTKGDQVLDIRLSEEEAREKDFAMRKIPLIAHDVEEILAAEGADALVREQFNLPLSLESLPHAPGFKPYYEEFGEQRVRSGIYFDVIRASHMTQMLAQLMKLID